MSMNIEQWYEYHGLVVLDSEFFFSFLYLRSDNKILLQYDIGTLLSYKVL